MLKLAQLAAFATLGALAVSPSYADNSKAAAMVNGKPVPQERVDMRIKFAANQGQADTPELRKMVRDELITLEVLSQEASKKDLDKQPEIVQQLELARQNTLANAFVQDYAKNHPISDDALKQDYEKLGTKEYKLSHILVATEAEAKAIAAQLKKKGNFAKIAKEKSMDTGSGEHGGELGWNVPGSFVKPFGDAVVNLKKGQLSEPVQSQFGWHIIKLEDVRDITPFEQVKPMLMRQQQQQSIQKFIAELRAKAKIE